MSGELPGNLACEREVELEAETFHAAPIWFEDGTKLESEEKKGKWKISQKNKRDWKKNLVETEWSRK